MPSKNLHFASIIMFVKRRKVVNFNNNDLLENNNHPFNKNVLTKFCLQHKFDCDGNSQEVNWCTSLIDTDF